MAETFDRFVDIELLVPSQARNVLGGQTNSGDAMMSGQYRFWVPFTELNQCRRQAARPDVDLCTRLVPARFSYGRTPRELRRKSARPPILI